MPSHDIAAFLTALHPTGTYEIRVPNCPDRPGEKKWRKTLGGWFRREDVESAVSDIRAANSKKPPGIYVTLNPCSGELLALSRKLEKAVKTTADSDILFRRRLVIDIDPVRLAGIASTDDELSSAEQTAEAISGELSAAGWPAPIVGMSGNGYYLIYATDKTENSEANRDRFSRLLGSLSARFSSDAVSVDETMFNASRIIKVLGTWSRKGEHQPEPIDTGEEVIPARPHRQSWHEIPDDWDQSTVSIEQIDAWIAANKSEEELLAEQAAEENAEYLISEEFSGYTEFSLDEWIAQHNVPVKAATSWGGGRKWVFSELPPLCQGAASGHTDFPSAIIETPSGAISAKCQHERCTWDWKDLRAFYEPGCYNKAEQRSEAKRSGQAPTHSDVKKGRPEESEAKKEERMRNKIGRVAFCRAIRNGDIRVEKIPGDEMSFRFSIVNVDNDYGSHEINSTRLIDPLRATDFFDSFFEIIIPVMPRVQWHMICEEIRRKAVRVEPDEQRNMMAVTASGLLKVIQYGCRGLEGYVANQDKELADYPGVYLDKHRLLIDFSKVLAKLRRDIGNDCDRMWLSRVLSVCQARKVNVRRRGAGFNENFLALNEPELDELASLTGMESGAVILELAAANATAAMRKLGQTLPEADDLAKRPDKQDSNDFFEIGASVSSGDADSDDPLDDGVPF